MRNCPLTKADYETIKSHLTMRQVAGYYGYAPDRRGWCRCPFHNDSHPSLLLYPDGRGFYCFSCGVGGDAITFVARLENVSNAAAARILVQAFRLPVNLDNPSYRERREREKSYRRRQELMVWAADTRMWLSMYRQLLCEALRVPGGSHFDEALQELSIVEYRLECLRECPEDYYADRKAVRKVGALKRRLSGWNDVAGAGEGNAG